MNTPFFLGDEEVEKKSSSVTIISSEAIVKSPYIDFFGTLKNTSKVAVSDVSIVVDMFDEKGKFIYQCDKTLSEVIQTDSEAYFKVNCFLIPKEIFEGYSAYKIRVAN